MSRRESPENQLMLVSRKIRIRREPSEGRSTARRTEKSYSNKS